MTTNQEQAKLNFFHAQNGVLLPSDWRITIYYYAAVHAVNHLMFEPGCPPPGFYHEHRRAAIPQWPELRPVQRDYLNLEWMSLVARYMPELHPMSPAQVVEAEKLATSIMKACGITPVAAPGPGPAPPAG